MYYQTIKVIFIILTTKPLILLETQERSWTCLVDQPLEEVAVPGREGLSSGAESSNCYGAKQGRNSP